MPKVGEVFVEIFAKNQRLRGGLAEASSLIRDWSLVVTGLTQGITNAFRTIATVGIKTVTISLGVLTTAFALTAKSGAEFQDNIIRAFVIMRESSGATSQSLRALTQEAIRLGSETLFSATQAAIGLQTLARAGFNTQQAISAIGPVLDLAIVGNIELAESSNIATAAMFGFGLEAEDMKKVVDVLSLASSQANTTISLLGSALGFVAPVALSAGISMEETSAAIGILSNAGIRGSRSGTTLRRALSILLAPTGRAKKIFDDLGLAFTTTEGKLESFTNIIRKLNQANLTAAQIQTIFGRIAGPGMAALLRQGSVAIEGLTNKLENAEGAADRMSQSFRTTVKGRVRDLGASVINLGLAFSEEFNEPLADTIFGIRNFIKEITESLQKTGIFRTVVEGTISVLAPFTDKIKELSSRFKEFLLGLTPQDVTMFFENMRIRIDAFIKKLIESRDSIVSFFKGAVTAVMAFINPVIFIIKTFDGLSDSVKRVVGFLLGLSSTILVLTGGLIPIISLYVLFNLFITRNAILAIKTSVANLGLAKSQVAVGAAAKASTAGMVGFGVAVKAAFAAAAKFTIIVAGLISVFLLATAAGRGFFGLFEGKTFGEGFEEGVQQIKSIFEVLFSKLPDLFGKSLEDMKAQLGKINLFQDLPKQLKDSMKGIGAEAAEEGPITVDSVTFTSKRGKEIARRSLERRKRFKIGVPQTNIARELSQMTPAGRATFAREQAKERGVIQGDIITPEQVSNMEKAVTVFRSLVDETTSGLDVANINEAITRQLGVSPLEGIGGGLERLKKDFSAQEKSVFGTTGLIGTFSDILAPLQGSKDMPVQGPKESTRIEELGASIIKKEEEISKIKSESNSRIISMLTRIFNSQTRTKEEEIKFVGELKALGSTVSVKTGKDDADTQSNIGNGIGVQPTGTN